MIPSDEIKYNIQHHNHSQIGIVQSHMHYLDNIYLKTHKK
jgi:hypothetical protein